VFSGVASDPDMDGRSHPATGSGDVWDQRLAALSGR
jgi:hypothetical protein